MACPEDQDDHKVKQPAQWHQTVSVNSTYAKLIWALIRYGILLQGKTCIHRDHRALSNNNISPRAGSGWPDYLLPIHLFSDQIAHGCL